jgi:hypothetical protein
MMPLTPGTVGGIRWDGRVRQWPEAPGLAGDTSISVLCPSDSRRRPTQGRQSLVVTGRDSPPASRTGRCSESESERGRRAAASRRPAQHDRAAWPVGPGRGPQSVTGSTLRRPRPGAGSRGPTGRRYVPFGRAVERRRSRGRHSSS